MLNALVSYYDRLAAEPESDIAPFGFSRQRISFEIVLKRDGTLVQFADARTDDAGRQVPKSLVVPGQAKPTGSGINPGFLWDNSAYMIGFKPDDPKPQRTREAFEAFRERHLSVEAEIEDEAFSAVCKFLRAWDPADAANHPELVERTGSFGVFRLAGVTEYAHERAKVVAYWKTQIAEKSNGPVGMSLVSGIVQPLARLHEPKIKGVVGSQSSGAAIVSFNLDAFESYGKEQSFNSPVGIEEAFQYCTALDRLTSDKRRRVLLGDTTTVFWSERPTAFEDDFLGVLDDPASAEDQGTIDRMRAFLNSLRNAAAADEQLENADVPFYVLGLSPNAARLSVRFWQAGTVQQFAERLGHHISRLEVVGLQQAPTLRQIVLETARQTERWSDADSVSPSLPGALLRSVLIGAAYPQTLMSAILRRIGAEGSVTPGRAAILKAILIRNWSITMDVYLNKNHPEKAYHCGRLLAVLAFVQEQALGTVNSGVVRRNLGSVMASPGLYLGRLQRAAEVGHIPKLEPPDLQVFVRDELKSVNVMLRDDLPIQLDLRLQGVFALGFYQQLQYLDFTAQQVSGRRRYRTAQGDWVRSKLEVRTANTLAKLGQIYVYEMAAILPSAGERWPDFVVRGKGDSDNLFIEVLGMDTPEYNDRWELKRTAYEEFGITESGGPRGRLVVLDFRKSQFDELTVANALRGRVMQAETE